MKRILIALLLFVGFFLASCEEEHHERRYGYRGPYGYRPPYESREYRDGYDGRRHRLMDETAQNETVSPAETMAEP